MRLEVFIHFDGNCRQALDFYEKVFNSKVQHLMTYGETPADPDIRVTDADKDRVCYAGIPVGDITLMFSDVPSNHNFVVGNNISPTFSTDNKDEVDRIYNCLKEEGEVFMELQKTFFSELYCMVKDKFGIIWQILYYVCNENSEV